MKAKLRGTPRTSTAARHSDPRRERLEHALESAVHLLPAQGPITQFIHHNTLHAFEEFPFDEALRKGSQIFGCQTYLHEEQYRRKLKRGRIRRQDLEAVLGEDLESAAGEPLCPSAPALGTRINLRLAMLEHSFHTGTAAELRWFVAETDALRQFRTEAPAELCVRLTEDTRDWAMRDLLRNRVAPIDGDKNQHGAELANIFEDCDVSNVDHWTNDAWRRITLKALWRVCRKGMHGVKSEGKAPQSFQRHRDLLLQATGIDADLRVNDILIRFCAAFLDQGLAPWSMPARDEGFLPAFHAMYSQARPVEPWLARLPEELRRIQAEGLTPLDLIQESLDAFGVPESEWERFLSTTLLALRGWAGMIRQVEIRADRVVHPVAPHSVVDFAAVRLLLDRLAAETVAEETLHSRVPLTELRALLQKSRPARHVTVDQRAFRTFQLAQVMGWTPRVLSRLSKAEWRLLAAEIESFSNWERRRLYHLAFERKYRIETLDAVSQHSGRPARADRPRFQAVFCIDEREESFRRHLEETAPEVQTFGAAGFFGVAMYYRGSADAHYKSLCPVVLTPQHWVVENPAYTLEKQHQRRAIARRVLGSVSHYCHVFSRSFFGGAVAGIIGVAASLPLVARVLFPRLTAQIRRKVSTLVAPPSITQLVFERSTPNPSCKPGSIGYSLPEMAGIVERTLRDIGLIENFARMIYFFGHGSSSMNNPHEAAYDCGACGGACGGPNARVFARMANDPRVRRMLAGAGIVLPEDTVFVGCSHNTCNDGLTYFDLDRLPDLHRGEFEDAVTVFDRVRQFNAQERCRRFVSAPLSLTSEEALAHVESRSEDLAQVRPECGHATNAVCVVGRRQRTRDLYMDRRAFLMSYDPTQDDAVGTVLERVLGAVVPVCAGINLEYYFSYVDSTGWGCGTKLPHNITSLLGVMDGAASDLRPGLPWQMVEIHEPMRCVFIIETTPEIMTGIMDRNETIGRLCRNQWVQLAVLDPWSGAVQVLGDDGFESYSSTGEPTPETPSSIDWYRGWRDHLGYATIATAKARARTDA